MRLPVSRAVFLLKCAHINCAMALFSACYLCGLQFFFFSTQMHKHVLFPSVECKLSMNYTSNGKWYHTSYNQDDIIIVCLDCTCSMYNTLYTALVTSMLFLMWLKISPIRQIEQRFTPYCAIIWSALIAKLCEKPTNASIAKEASGLIWPAWICYKLCGIAESYQSQVFISKILCTYFICYWFCQKIHWKSAIISPFF